MPKLEREITPAQKKVQECLTWLQANAALLETRNRNSMAQTFPNSADYISAIENAHMFVRDPILKKGRPRRGKDGELLFYSGGFAKVFVVDCDAKTYALRCWTTGIGDAEGRYNKVSEFLQKEQLPFFTEFDFIQDGILVNGAYYPIVRMEWVEALSLREFIGANLHNPDILRAAAENFLAMARTLHERQIAHGDLQSDNLKVRVNGHGPEFVLIDYDTLFVPSLAGTKVTSTGVAGYQHPARRRTSAATAKDDYFAELVIYLTLYAIAEEPQLWHDEAMHNKEKELIFAGDDFESPLPTKRFHRLRSFSPFVSKLTLALWNYTRCGDIQQLVPLENAHEICRGSEACESRISFDEVLKRQVAARSSSPQPQMLPAGWLLEDWPLGEPSCESHPPPLPPLDPRITDKIFWSNRNVSQPPPPPPPVVAGSTFEKLLRQRKGSIPPPLPGGALPPQKPVEHSRKANWILWVIVAVVLLLIISRCHGAEAQTTMGSRQSSTPDFDSRRSGELQAWCAVAGSQRITIPWPECQAVSKMPQSATTLISPNWIL